jgi:hypothetical protein
MYIEISVWYPLTVLFQLQYTVPGVLCLCCDRRQLIWIQVLYMNKHMQYTYHLMSAC